MIDMLIAEVTEYEFKAQIEDKKPKSWLKSVSAFANGIGGMLVFGVTDEGKIVGIKDTQSGAETISRLIKDRVSPTPEFILKAKTEEDQNILILKVNAGRTTPYYYAADGIKQAYIRIGNESVPAPNHILNELILKGSNRTFDSLET